MLVDPSGGIIVLGLALVAIGLCIYFLPTIIGHQRQISSFGALFFVNLLFGWTVLGWLLCLMWAATGATRAEDAFYEQAARQRRAEDEERAYTEAYARERARLDHEAEQRARQGRWS